MKYIYTLLISAFALCGCADFLDREPLVNLSPGNFWKSEDDLRLAANVFYQNMNRSYQIDNQTIDCFASVGNAVSSGTYTPPDTEEHWTKAYKQIRNANDFLANYERASVTDEVKNRYAGEARFFRAYFYFNLVKRYGDVPYVLNTLDLDSEELMGARTPKEQVIAGIIADLKFAEEHIPLKSKMKKDVGRVTKGAAQALLARVGLHFGTLNKYHGGSHKEFLQMARDASKRLIDTREYSLYKDYRSLFLAPGEDSDEHILSYRYSAEANTYNSRIRGIIADQVLSPTKYLADAFLCKDGLPAGKSAYEVAYLPLGKEFENRDPRMALTLWKPGDLFLGKPFVPNISTQTRTGYMFKKYGDEEAYMNMKSTIDEILIRYAEVLLMYAEASFELEDKISDTDLNLSVNALRARFDGHSDRLPDLTNAFANQHGLSLREEIRRERRVELAGESFRYEDIVRWKTAEVDLPLPILGAKFDQEVYPDTKPGSGVILDDKGFILVQKASTRTFEVDKSYLFPLPLRELSLNPRLVQNPNW